MTRAEPPLLPVLEARIEQLTEALLHLASELWVTRDRQALLEALLADEGISAPTRIDGHHPDEALAKRLAGEREALIASLIGYLAPSAKA